MIGTFHFDGLCSKCTVKDRRADISTVHVVKTIKNINVVCCVGSVEIQIEI